MPWKRALSLEEREQFLGLVRKMNETLASTPTPQEVSSSTALPATS
jgi:hypothetical protein